MNLYLFPNKIPKNDNNKNNQWIILIFNQQLRRIASKKWRKQKCNTQQICSRGWVSHSFSGKELTFPRLSFAHLCGSSSSGLEIEVGGLQCVSCSRSNGLFKQIAPILGIDSWMEQVEVQGYFYISFFPQIAIAIGVLTSNRGEGDEPLWRIGRGPRVPLQVAVDVVPLLGAIVGCHCSALWLGGRVTANFEGVDVVPWHHPTQQWHPEKASRKTALSFLQTLHRSLHW